MIKRIIGGVLILALLWAVVMTINKQSSLSNEVKNVEESPQVNFKRPSFALQGLDSQTYSTDQIKKPLVVNFWASWCGPCKIEAPELVNLYKQYQDQVEIYAVNLTTSDSESGASAFAQEYGFDFPVLLDKDGKVGKLYNVAAIPTTYFISSDGIIVDRIIGYGGKDVLKAKFKELVRTEE